jgi:5-carboxymethyl-2-hydroxymuconate isomerase
MPHFVIEYSRPLEARIDIGVLMQVAYEAGAASGIMQPADIKVRAVPYEHFRLEGGIETFIHVTVSLLAGRTNEQKEDLAIRLRSALGEHFPAAESISIDIRDMNPIAYKKRLLQRG